MDTAAIREKIERMKREAEERRLNEQKKMEEEQKAQEAKEAEVAGESEADIAAAKAAANERSVFLGNVDFAATEADLRRIFGACGEIKRCTIQTDHYTHRPKGFAYIEFSDMMGVENAQKLQGVTLYGREIVVKPKRENKPRAMRSPRRRFPRRQ